MKEEITRRDDSQLSFEDTVVLSGTPSAVWRIISDPASLAMCIPGAEAVAQPTERTFEVEIRQGIHRFQLSLSGEIELTEVHEPEWILAEGTVYDSTTHSSINGIAGMEISPINPNSVELAYESHLDIHGGSASLPKDIMRMVIQSSLDEYFSNIQAILDDTA